MAWGSLRGSLAVVMVLLIPDNTNLPSWPYAFSIKEFIIAITIGSIFFTLLVKATTMGTVIRWLKIDALLLHEQLSYYKSKALTYKDLIRHSKNFMIIAISVLNNTKILVNTSYNDTKKFANNVLNSIWTPVML